MAGWLLYDYLDRRGENVFKVWTNNLQSGYRGMLKRRIKALEETERGLIPNLIDGPLRKYQHIYKLRVGGKVRLRPLLCKGPIEKDTELTFLIGATERDFVFDPLHAPQTADDRRQEIIGDPRRRCTHDKT